MRFIVNIWLLVFVPSQLCNIIDVDGKADFTRTENDDDSVFKNVKSRLKS